MSRLPCIPGQSHRVGIALAFSFLMADVAFLMADVDAAGPSPTDSGGQPPSIVLILADDLGYADLGCYGATDARTPHIDSLARDGCRFTNFYAMGPQCTPSRTALLTGRYPQRAGGLECAIGTGNVGRYDEAIELAARGELGLPPEQAVLAPALQSRGYVSAIFGKWHLGYDAKFNPLDQGFDEFAGFLGGNVEYFRHYELSDLDVFLRGREPVDREGYLTDLISDDAVDFLRRQAETPDRPFFLYLPHAAPHFPFQGPEDRDPEPTAETWMTGTRESYVAMVESLDRGVGRVLRTLDEIGRTENTIVIFTSDHGAMPPGRNTPWRDFKSTLFEGGIRVPFLVRWPGRFPPGSESRHVGTLMDLTQSLLRIAGAAVPDGGGLDGIDILGEVLSDQPPGDRELYWRYRRGDLTWRAVRAGDSKLIVRQSGDQVETWLFDLGRDPTETRNLAARRVGQRDRLAEMLRRWELATVPVRP